jgi:hypothetical protein
MINPLDDGAPQRFIKRPGIDLPDREQPALPEPEGF